MLFMRGSVGPDAERVSLATKEQVGIALPFSGAGMRVSLKNDAFDSLSFLVAQKRETGEQWRLQSIR